jgi:hypothetical protein
LFFLEGATELLLEKLDPLAEGYLAVNPYSYWSMDEPMLAKIREYTAANYPDVKYRPIYYMQGFFDRPGFCGDHETCGQSPRTEL